MGNSYSLEFIFAHIHTHCTGGKAPKCKECWKAITLSSGLGTHLKASTGEKAWDCEECGNTFAHSMNLNMLPYGRKSYERRRCGEAFQDSTCLNVHNQTHSGASYMNADSVGKTLLNPQHLLNIEKLTPLVVFTSELI